MLGRREAPAGFEEQGGGQQWQQVVAIRLAVNAPDVAAMKLGRIGNGQQLYQSDTTGDIEFHPYTSGADRTRRARRVQVKKADPSALRLLVHPAQIADELLESRTPRFGRSGPQD